MTIFMFLIFYVFLIISKKMRPGGGRFLQNSIRTIKSRLSADSSRKTDVTMIRIVKKQALGAHFVQSLFFFSPKHRLFRYEVLRHVHNSDTLQADKNKLNDLNVFEGLCTVRFFRNTGQAGRIRGIS